jgi:hypothetical protein
VITKLPLWLLLKNATSLMNKPVSIMTVSLKAQNSMKEWEDFGARHAREVALVIAIQLKLMKESETSLHSNKFGNH